MKIRVIVTGATGMVGEGVLHECLNHGSVEKVLVIGRRPCGYDHQKLSEIIHTNFHDLSSIEKQLGGYNACFFCLGASSVGMKEADYRSLSYDLTMHVAKTLTKYNPDMTFCYVSGAGTDSTEKGKLMWARVKGKTENDLMKLPFRRSFAFRPALMIPTRGLKRTHGYYRVMAPLFPLFQKFFPQYISTLKEVGLAMINASVRGYDKAVLEVKDINALAKLDANQ